MSVPGELNEPGTWDAGSNVAGRLNVGDRISGSVHHHHRDANAWQDVAHIDRAEHTLEGRQSRRAGRCLRIPHEEPDVRQILRNASPRPGQVFQGDAMFREIGNLLVGFLPGWPPRIVIGSDPAGLSAPQQQRACTPGERCREKEGQVGPFGVPEYDCPVAPGCIHHGPDVVHPLLQRCGVGWTIRQTRSTFVETDQPAERAKPLQEAGLLGPLPVKVKMRGGTRRQDQIDRAPTRHLICDPDIPARRILGIRLHRRPVSVTI